MFNFLLAELHRPLQVIWLTGCLSVCSAVYAQTPYASFFEEAYIAHPEIPRGLLEAVSYNRTRIRHITAEEAPSCVGLPKAFGLFGLIENGEGYFSNTLELVSDLSAMNAEQVRTDPRIQVLAFAKAICSVPVSGWEGEALTWRLRHLSELPHETERQQFAQDVQLFEVISLLTDPEFMQRFGYETLDLNLEELFGENLTVLSSRRVVMNGERVFNESGETYRAGGAIGPCFDYASDAYVQTPSCNYSSRSGTPVSAVTIHTIQGSYAGAISWAQNCNANVSYHYVVSSTGQITQMLCEADKGWHVGSENPYTIGIEHDGYISDPDNYTPAMYAATADLCYDITQSGYGIEAVRTAYFPWAATTHYNSTGTPGPCVKIKGHQHFPNQTHTDPGQYWDWDHFYKLVNQNTSVTVLTDAMGEFYDTGGQIGVYPSDERSLTLIAPANATSITVEFQEFDLEDEWDYLYIYDGTDVFSPLIGYYTGTNSPGTVTSNNGTLLFEFRSDCATAETGWAATWTSEGADHTPPTVNVNAGVWETADFYATYTENDEPGGSGIVDEERFSCVLDFNGIRWAGNTDRGHLYDDFSPALNEWAAEVGNWTLTSGVAEQTDEIESNTNLHIPIVQQPFSNYLYSFKMKLNGSGTNRRAGMHFMCSDATLPNRGNSYFIYLRADNDKVQIYKVTNDVWELKTNDDLNVEPSVWYAIKTVYNQLTGEIRVYVDGALVSTWTDPTPLTSGNSISLRTGNCSAQFDDIRVYKSRIGAQPITVGNTNSDVRYQNPDPGTPACEIRTFIFDHAGNCSAEDSVRVNIDWTPPILFGVQDGASSDIDETNDGSQLFANWQPASDPHSGIDRYDVAIGTTPGDQDLYGWTDQGLNVSINVPYALTPNQWYYTTVKAINAAGLETADTSDGQQFVDVATGVTEWFRTSVYPNPTFGVVHLPQVEGLNWYLLDVTGRAIASGNEDTRIDLRALKIPESVYILQLSTGRNTVSRKLIFQKQ